LDAKGSGFELPDVLAKGQLVRSLDLHVVNDVDELSIAAGFVRTTCVSGRVKAI